MFTLTLELLRPWSVCGVGEGYPIASRPRLWMKSQGGRWGKRMTINFWEARDLRVTKT